MDVDNKFGRFLKDLTSLTNKHAPMKKRSRKEMKLKDKPWINSKMLKMMRIRDRILQILKKKQTDDNIKLYKEFRNRVSNELKESKARYFHNYFSTNSQNMKKLWSGIKTIISHKSSSSSAINKIKDKDGSVTSDPCQMSNIFNDFYVNIANEITKTIPLTPKSPLDYLTKRVSNSLFLTPVTEIEVKDIISILNPSKSVGPNSIPIKLLKVIGSSISPLLALELWYFPFISFQRFHNERSRNEIFNWKKINVSWQMCRNCIKNSSTAKMWLQAVKFYTFRWPIFIS